MNLVVSPILISSFGGILSIKIPHLLSLIISTRYWVVAEGIRIHPNPTDDLLYLTADSRRFTQYTIIDALGNTLLSGPVDPTVRTMKLPTADLTPGIYFLQLRGRKTRWQSLRFVVVK